MCLGGIQECLADFYPYFDIIYHRQASHYLKDHKHIDEKHAPLSCHIPKEMHYSTLVTGAKVCLLFPSANTHFLPHFYAY